jgi:hypothetical protein
MASFATQKAAAVLFLILVLPLLARTAPKRQPANLDGYVYEKCADSKLVGPVRGAVVSTSVDATTASTDAAGHFHLVTKNPVFIDERHNVRVHVGEVVVEDNRVLGPFGAKRSAGSPVHLNFVLSPPEPVLVGVKSGSCYSYPFRHSGAKQQK